MKSMRLFGTISFVGAMALAAPAHAFCGFYVAKADAKLFNKASRVALVRDGDRTVMTMSNDFQGDLKEFAIVIPVPVSLEKDQVHVGERTTLDRLDAWSSPRLVEYWDSDPCAVAAWDDWGIRKKEKPMRAEGQGQVQQSAKAHGVTIEQQYTVGEYDILILAAKQSDGLSDWLTEEGYKLPKGATEILGSYIQQQMHFFVAKVNLTEQAKTGFTYLRPLQVAYESPKFMLPIRLGTVNADGPQELFVFALTKKGRVETTNYRTVKLPTGQNVPEYVKDDFGPFYKAMFAQQVKKEDMHAVFTEHAWDMGWCDPCAADPLSADELRKAGVWWLNPGQGVGGVFLTRLHVRYDAAHFPEDLVFQETSDRTNFQGRYVLQHAFAGSETEKCAAMRPYRQQLRARHRTEAATLAELTGWDAADIKKKMKPDGDDDSDGDKSWYRNLWK